MVAAPIGTRMIRSCDDRSRAPQRWAKLVHTGDADSIFLVRELVAVIESCADAFDFGVGDGPFKRRCATQVRQIHAGGLHSKMMTT